MEKTNGLEKLNGLEKIITELYLRDDNLLKATMKALTHLEKRIDELEKIINKS